MTSYKANRRATSKFVACLVVFFALKSPLLFCVRCSKEDQSCQKDITPVDPHFFYPNRFLHRTILITGGANGVGKAVALRAAKEGANVVIADSAPEGSDVVQEITNHGGNAIFVLTNVSSSSDCQRMVQRTVERFVNLDMVVNSAFVTDCTEVSYGCLPSAALLLTPVHMASDEYWQRVFQVNVGGLFRSMRAELAQMIKQSTGGAVVNVASVGALTGLPLNPAYVASEHAVSGLTRNAAIDYAPYGIRINSVNMAATADLFTPDHAKPSKPSEAAGAHRGTDSQLKKMSLLQMANSEHRPATVWEQVGMILFLLSDEASNLTGGLFATDGGYTAF